MNFKDWRKLQHKLKDILSDNFLIGASSHHVFGHYNFSLTNVCILIVSFDDEGFYFCVRNKSSGFDLHKKQLEEAVDKMRLLYIKLFGI